MTKRGLKRKIMSHHAAHLLATGYWTCMCGKSLGLPKQEGLSGPTKELIIEAWAVHLAELLIRSMR